MLTAEKMSACVRLSQQTCSVIKGLNNEHAQSAHDPSLAEIICPLSLSLQQPAARDGTIDQTGPGTFTHARLLPP